MGNGAEYKFVVTDYWKGAERTHRGVLHSSRTDRVWCTEDIVARAVERLGAVDGDEITIIVSRTGRRPFGSRRVHQVGTHDYLRDKVEKEPVAPLSK